MQNRECAATSAKRAAAGPLAGRVRNTGTQLAVAVFALASPALADRFDDCSQTGEPDRQLRGCTQILLASFDTERRAIAYNNRGNAYDNKGDFERAVSDYTKAISLDPKHAGAYRNRCTVYVKVKKKDLALADCTKTVELAKDDPWSYFARARAHGDDHTSAIADYSRAIAVEPLPSFFLSRGAAYRESGQYDLALKDVQKVREIAPKDLRAIFHMGDTLRAKGDHAKAIEAYGQYIEGDPKYAGAYMGRALALLKQGNAEAARADAEQAVKLAPEYAGSLDVRAQVREALALKEDAVADYKAALRIDPGFEPSREALKRLGVAP